MTRSTSRSSGNCSSSRLVRPASRAAPFFCESSFASGASIFGCACARLSSSSCSFSALGVEAQVRLLQRGDIAIEARLLVPEPREVVIQLRVLALQLADLGVERGALVRHRVAGPAGNAVVATGEAAVARVEPQHAVGGRRERIASVLGIRRRLRERLHGKHDYRRTRDRYRPQMSRHGDTSACKSPV